MAGGDEPRDEQWGNTTARKTFIWTLIGAVLFVGSVAIFVLGADVRR
ncbi:MAG: hypothetical protein ACRENJ_01775 [Candidatus Eiseniibacteriota bacterium]